MRITACTLVFAVLLGGCVSARRGVIGDDIPGSAVAGTIDTQIAPILRTVPGLAVGKAACPEHLDVSNAKVGYCTLPAGGTTLRVAVTSGREFGTYFVHQADGLIDVQSLERGQHVTLAEEYGLHADVNCGPPRFRAVTPGTRLSCHLTGRNLPADRIDFKVLDAAGHVFAFRPPGARSAGMDALLPYLALHKRGRRTIVPGVLVAHKLSSWMRSEARRDRGLRITVGAATCPDVLDLSGARRGICRMRVLGQVLRYETWIDEPAGMNFRSLEFAWQTKRVAAAAVDSFQKRLEAAGIAQMVAIDCGPDRVVVVTTKRGVPCKLTYGTTTRPMTAYPDTAHGMLRFDVPPQ